MCLKVWKGGQIKKLFILKGIRIYRSRVSNWTPYSPIPPGLFVQKPLGNLFEVPNTYLGCHQNTLEIFEQKSGGIGGSN